MTARLVCAACGWTPGAIDADPYPFRCARAGSDDGDHVMVTEGLRPRVTPAHADSLNPFIRYRCALYSWHFAQAHGLTDADYVSMVERVDATVARVAGRGFRITPFCRTEGLALALGFDDAWPPEQAVVAPPFAPDRPSLDAPGGVWVKDETGNVSGSHKARHLMGVALYLEVLRLVGLDDGKRRPLAVASCGNAALAAAVVARAIERRLLVFVPDHAPPSIVAQLEGLGAEVTRCARSGSAAGDPCYLAFRHAIDAGAIPFSCQGNENGLVIEGAKTIGYEIVEQIRAEGTGAARIDRVFVQVGGGALASACVQALAECARDGRLAAMPRIHAVQTGGGYPLKRAYDRVADRIVKELARRGLTSGATARDGERASDILRSAPPAVLDEVFAYARTHRSEFMWPWETEPRSVAHGILDDETYDWAVVVEAMVRSGGFPIVVDEATLEEANLLGRRSAGIDVDHTGSSGLAGLVALARSADKPDPAERVVLLFTGMRRSRT